MIARIFGYFEEGVLNLLITLMTLLVFTEVVARFFFDTGFLWIQELTLTLCGWFVLFGMSYGVKVGAHIGVDALVKKLPPNAKKITSLITTLICLTYCILFLKGSWSYLSQMYQIGVPMEDIHFPAWLLARLDPDWAWNVLKIDIEDGAVPIWISQSILLIGFSMLTWRFIELFVAILRNQVTGLSFADEAKESMHLIDDTAIQSQGPQHTTGAAHKELP
ncbi:TRAP transporter small permease [Shewanella oneidensis MR-1]|uniref:TRAP transporter small permease protein n=1 Tax=Shewanella oneidensis (strain ATCC 700550 / JCM 31522 / CIP 106686 / LMG 19005 / NCIMB 14063 / MR-1) TaxID=211586 RepID=Q8ECK3_SHEON|nr:TRAP transporter small permease subunit [Shewanella oneidensis]AAN56139.1 TRAP-type C4-dicarboxylate:H+ symport system small permease component DctQ [Shewanella oneidensis MR-1]MDX5999430.1 TRAP transporter small permease [Shewanella oneidensis]MEE2026486.1 C4-dicarboxylate TRAP transporter small permease protein DctQ [Shewanella oneidensis]QKG97572.1 TRAP transporter small permease [Shewanella oneidensis MR-1]